MKGRENRRCKMVKRIATLTLALLLVGLVAAAQSISPTGTQRVLLHFPAKFHDEELIHVLQQFVDREADIYVTASDTLSGADVEALRARIPDRFFNLTTGLSGGPRVTVIPEIVSIEFRYDKVIFLGAGWYDEYFESSGYTEPRDPSYSDGLYWFIGRSISEHATIGAVGPGVYPLIFSGVLPEGTKVPAYKCDQLTGAIQDQGYQANVAEETPREDGGWPPLVTAETYGAAVNSAEVRMTPIPTSWYPTTDGFGSQVISDYTYDYSAFVISVEDAFLGLPSDGSVRIKSVRCEDNGYAIVQNTGKETVNLAGWKIEHVDPSTGRTLATHTFGNYALAPGAEVAVYWGSLMWTSPENYVYWEDGPFLPGIGERFVLVDPGGTQRSSMDCT
jgi:hypothetical protein